MDKDTAENLSDVQDQEQSIGDILAENFDVLADDNVDSQASGSQDDAVADEPAPDGVEPAAQENIDESQNEPVTDEKNQGPARDKDGRFAKSEPEPSVEDKAPSSWKADVAGKWAEVPAEVRAEIQRRESDYHKGIEQYKQYAGLGHTMERAIAPYAENIRRSGIEPAQAISHLLGIENSLRNGSPEQKAQTVTQILRDYGISLDAVQAPVPLPPEVQKLQYENQQLQRFQQSVMDQQNQAALSDIEQFKADPANVHFDTVREDMAILLQSNRATSLKDAYDQAVWMRPDIRKSLIEQQRTEAEQKAAAQARNKRAQSAAVGIKGTATKPGSSLSSDASLRDTISAAIDGEI